MFWRTVTLQDILKGFVSMDSLGSDWVTLLVPIAIAGIGFWLRHTIKEIVEKHQTRWQAKWTRLTGNPEPV